MKIPWQSIRFRLTLWNTCILAIALVLFTIGIRVTVQANFESGIDRRLVHDTEMMARFVTNNDLPRPGLNQAPPFQDRNPNRNNHPRPQNEPREEMHRRPNYFNLQGVSNNPNNPNKPWDMDGFRQAAAGKSVFTRGSENSEPLRIYSVPVVQDGKVIGVVQNAHALTEMNRLLQGLSNTLLMFIPFALLAAGVGGAYLTKRALRPVRDIAQAAEHIEAQNLSQRLPEKGKDEFSELSSTFNRMFARLNDAFRNIEAALERQKRFTADASHELRTPLTTIKANTSLALRAPRSAEEYSKSLRAVDKAADIMSNLVQDLLLLARSDNKENELPKNPFLLKDAIQSAVTLSVCEDQPKIEVINKCMDTLIYGDLDSFTRVFINLLSNACKHTPKDGSVVITVSKINGKTEVVVKDSGCGIASEHLPHLFERFYRVDEARTHSGTGGFGLGLAICKTIVEEHHGDIQIESVMGGGTTVRVILPVDAGITF